MLLENPRADEGISDFESRAMHDGRLWLHVHASQRYKSTTVDLFLPTLLQPRRATGLALIARLLERGTQAHPDLRALNRYTDWLYGANYFAATQRFGAYQVLRLHLAAVDDRFLPQPESLGLQGAQLLSDVLLRPHAPQGVFGSAWVEQERLAHKKSIAASMEDRSVRAQRRCIQIMCPNEPYRLSADGDATEVDLFDGRQLTELLASHTRQSVAHLYVCGDVDMAQAMQMSELFAWERADNLESLADTGSASQQHPQQVIEFGDASQGRLMIGHRGGIHLGHPEYPAFLLLNVILGGEMVGRLYRRVRELEGLCYHIASYIEPMAGFLFVEAGIEVANLDRVQQHIADELTALGSAGPTDEELDNARLVIQHRLNAIADHRDALVHFDLQRRLAQAQISRGRLASILSEVDADQIRNVAAQLRRDTTYLLAPETAAEVVPGAP
ncbi:MAG: insulinase family protein [Gemmatimonadetes bacterium]|nr:insulinase family protein [Gemmatimonadota bacterium]MBT5141905.1 insulinase family protein [Gemmatimonadota bacterium]MBT7594056.1 insulinase family protein [Gemmatimonadota bacterium]